MAYCKASIRRVIVRFRSLSDRRNSSIFLMECSGVVFAAELAADLRKRSGGKLFDNIHCYLPRICDRARVAADLQVLLPQIEVLTHSFLDQVDGDALFLGSNDVAQHLLRGPQ